MRTNRLESISIAEIETIINGIATNPYSSTQILSLLQVEKNHLQSIGLKAFRCHAFVHEFICILV